MFNQTIFDVLCSDLNAVPLSRAAAASSAVPVVLSSVTINNYGGTCDKTFPPWTKLFLDSPNPPRPAARAIRELREAHGATATASIGRTFTLSTAASPTTSACAACSTRSRCSRRCTTPACRRGSTTRAGSSSFVVNSLSTPPTNWDESESPPGTIDILLKATGVPIDHYSFEAIELLKDTQNRWDTMQADSREARSGECTRSRTLIALRAFPHAEIYAIDVSFPMLSDKAELDYLNQQPTSFVLPPEAVDRLRAAAGTIIMASPEFQRLLKDVGARIVPPAEAPATSPPPAK